MIDPNIVLGLYIIGIILFILALRWMSEVRTCRRGNWAAASGMAFAIVATLLAYEIQRIDLLLAAVAVGLIVGAPIAFKVPMTAVPQRTAVSQAFGSLAVALIGTAEYYTKAPNVDTFTMAVPRGPTTRDVRRCPGLCFSSSKVAGVPTTGSTASLTASITASSSPPPPPPSSPPAAQATARRGSGTGSWPGAGSTWRGGSSRRRTCMRMVPSTRTFGNTCFRIWGRSGRRRAPGRPVETLQT